MPVIRVLLVDNHALVRAGIQALLQNLPGIEVIAVAGNGHEALRLIQTERPAVTLMDISMPELNGLEATARVSKEFPAVRVVMLSAHANEEYVLQSLRAGAVGYVLKDAGPEELEIAIRAAAQGDSYLSPAVSRHVVADYVRRAGVETSTLERLTSRQREILQLIAEGRTSREIAARLYISPKTVETHRTQLMERLNIHDVAGLVRYAIRSGLVASEE
ncbi:MAG TPA: response regulator transcription factor [Abditibacteriaceae bacterium]|nr:response regulator transcription factor [Abditibacteriaceae bacterium]